MSGTELCDILLQKALDLDIPNLEEIEERMYIDSYLNNKPKRTPAIKKNQLTQGKYKIGMDLPFGKYDFEHVWGNGKK
jgi:hypothetical protein